MDATQALSARLRSARRDAPRKLLAAFDAGLQRFAIHPKQRLQGGHYTELCASYVATMGDWSYETARQAWKLLRSCVGWTQLTKEQAEERGIRLRPLLPGQRHGHHLLLAGGFTEAIQGLCAELGIATRTPDEALDWEDVTPKRKGSSLMCCCPFHEDRNPSMILDPRRGCATCFACGSSHRYDPDAQRVSTRTDQEHRPAPPRPPPPPPARAPKQGQKASSSETSTIDTPGALVGRRGVLGFTGGRSDLWVFGVLQRSEVEARAVSGARLWQFRQRMRDKRRRPPPDRLVCLDEMRPARGDFADGGYTYQAVSERFVGVDIDNITPNPHDEDGDALEAAGQRLERWAWQHPHLSGRVALTQTSLYGVQVLFELAAPQGRGWRRSVEGAPVCDACDQVALQEMAAAGYHGGHADQSVRGSGRMVRRPGLRVDKRGDPYVSRLRHLTPADADHLKRAPKPSEVVDLREEHQFRQLWAETPGGTHDAEV